MLVGAEHSRVGIRAVMGQIRTLQIIAHIDIPCTECVEPFCLFSFRSEFHVVNPLAIELPRSLGTVVTNWNLPMHVFLKNCEF